MGGLQSHPAPQGDAGLVCRWNGATKSGSHSAGGMVLSSEGGVLRAAGVQFSVIDDPVIAELLALREAVKWCLAQGFSMIRFEGDAKVIIDKIRRREVDDSRMGAVLSEVVQICALHPGLSIRFVGRRSNKVAHLVGRKALLMYPAACRAVDFRAWLSFRM
ncbi:unnamed protein product [Linum trigynum]|uniref:RNase H type-1 domain-containing protein n=1 Tax=Linum trigynum TaxID=586398 RepID=A0AAV2F1F8_9ROSI